MSIYAWCEDRGSGFDFWKEIFSAIYPNIIVETKLNNSRLRKAADSIENDGNEYYILMDSFIDNNDVLREIDGLKRGIKNKSNVHVIDVHSFEFVLLSFKSLIQWIFAEQDELKEKRKNFILARELLIEQTIQSSDVAKLEELEKVFPYIITHNVEQSAAELLYQITRNTGFETDKGRLGECFINSCCEWASRKADDFCGLDTNKLSADEKKIQILNESVLKSAFEKVGL